MWRFNCILTNILVCLDGSLPLPHYFYSNGLPESSVKPCNFSDKASSNNRLSFASEVSCSTVKAMEIHRCWLRWMQQRATRAKSYKDRLPWQNVKLERKLKNGNSACLVLKRGNHAIIWFPSVPGLPTKKALALLPCLLCHPWWQLPVSKCSHWNNVIYILT